MVATIQGALATAPLLEITPIIRESRIPGVHPSRAVAGHPTNRSDPTIEALGVTDYFCIDTYKEVRKRKAQGRLPDIKLLFPNVELRIDTKTVRPFRSSHQTARVSTPVERFMNRRVKSARWS